MSKLGWFVLVAMLAIPLGGCATAPDGKPAVCDGHHRRPANPYGSVLPMTPGVAPQSPSPTNSKSSAPPAPPPGPLSAVDPLSTAPCGGRA